MPCLFRNILVVLYVFRSLNPLSPHDSLKRHFTPENRLTFPVTKGFITKIPMKLAYQYVVISFNFSTKSNHLHPLQVENCGSNSRFVVDEDDYGKFRIEGVKFTNLTNTYCIP